MRMADGYVLRGEAELGAGDPIAAARAFERGREAWAAIVARQVSRGVTEAPAGRRSPSHSRTATPSASRHAVRRPTREPEPPTREVESLTPDQEFERANIMRLLQSFKRAFDSRSGDSLRPIWPTLSAERRAGLPGAVAARAVAAVDLQQRPHPHGRRRQARQRRHRGDGDVAHRRAPARTASIGAACTFSLERLGPLWVIASVSGI